MDQPLRENLTITSTLPTLQAESGSKPSFEEESRTPLQGFIFTETNVEEKNNY